MCTCLVPHSRGQNTHWTSLSTSLSPESQMHRQRHRLWFQWFHRQMEWFHRPAALVLRSCAAMARPCRRPVQFLAAPEAPDAMSSMQRLVLLGLPVNQPTDMSCAPHHLLEEAPAEEHPRPRRHPRRHPRPPLRHMLRREDHHSAMTSGDFPRPGWTRLG